MGGKHSVMNDVASVHFIFHILQKYFASYAVHLQKHTLIFKYSHMPSLWRDGFGNNILIFILILIFLVYLLI